MKYFFAVKKLNNRTCPPATTSPACSTTTGQSCVFPFTYNGATHYQCTYTDSPTPWCATAVDSSGVVVTNGWGDCEVSVTSAC